MPKKSDMFIMLVEDKVLPWVWLKRGYATTMYL